MKVSVVIPVYNAAPYLRAALDDRRAVYRNYIRKVIARIPSLLAEAKGVLSPGEGMVLQEVLAYPVSERIASFFRCWRDRGVSYTLKRVCRGIHKTRRPVV